MVALTAAIFFFHIGFAKNLFVQLLLLNPKKCVSASGSSSSLPFWAYYILDFLFNIFYFNIVEHRTSNHPF